MQVDSLPAELPGKPEASEDNPNKKKQGLLQSATIWQTQRQAKEEKHGEKRKLQVQPERRLLSWGSCCLEKKVDILCDV